MRHGEVRTALLLALQDGPAHGYELGQRLERASGGMWRPSPGSIYPTLQMLADEDLVSSEERDGKRIYTLTRTGRAEAKERTDRGEAAPWQAAYDDESRDLREEVDAVRMAVKQVGAIGSAEQRTRAREILAEARRQIYEILAKG